MILFFLLFHSLFSFLSFGDATGSSRKDTSLQLRFLLQSCSVFDRGRRTTLGPVRDQGTLTALPKRPGRDGLQGTHASCGKNPSQMEQPHCHVQEGEGPQPGDGTCKNVLGILRRKSTPNHILNILLKIIYTLNSTLGIILSYYISNSVAVSGHDYSTIAVL